MKIYEAMKSLLVNELGDANLELIGLEQKQHKDNEGVVTDYVLCHCQVPKGRGKISNCQFSVKIVDGRMKVQAEKLEETEYSVSFTNLIVSYVDAKNNVYFKADDYAATEVK